MKPARDHPLIGRLLKAKEHSDRGNYPAKHAVLRSLLRENPRSFRIDSRRGGMVGLTHESGFRIHMPAAALPDEFRATQSEDES
jgi:hypothetical protein